MGTLSNTKLSIFSGKKRDIKADEIKNAERSVYEQERAMKSKETEHRNKMKQIESDLGQKTELGRYTREMARLCQDIDRNVHMFK